jgi:hypothetical protein
MKRIDDYWVWKNEELKWVYGRNEELMGMEE